MLGLVVEGGANRTYYSIGVMDAFIDLGIEVDFFVGVSAGVANGTSYISRQKGRAIEIGLKYVPDKRYMGIKYFFKKGNGSYYNRDFIFNSIPNELVPFDYETFRNYPGEVYAVVTNLDTGKPEYKRVNPDDKEWNLIQASCALPFFFKPIELSDGLYFDGGCSDPLPVEFAFKKGCNKIISILTREEAYRKETETDVRLSSFLYRKNTDFAKTLKIRSKIYNDSKEYLYQKRREGKAFVFAPKCTRDWKRTEKSPQKLREMYNEGYRDAVERFEELKEFINS